MRFQDLFENTSGQIAAIGQTDIDIILKMVLDTFSGKGMDDAAVLEYTKNATDWHLSKKLVVNGKMVGFYLFAEGDVIDLVQHCDVKADLSRFENKNGIEGIALIVLPEYRGLSFGNRLKNLPKELGYDYVYGMQLKSLGNLNQWLKRRQLIADCDSVWVTAEIF